MTANNRFSPSWLTGLSTEEVAHQQKVGLKNTAPENITKTNGRIIKDNVLTLFNLFNFIIAVCLALVHSYSNIAFLSIIILNICIGIAQEIHAKNLVEELSLVTMPKAMVVRDGKETAVRVEDLVLDDVILFDGGKQICIDATLLHGEVEVNESLLTGEADTVLKRPGDLLLSGSFVVSGKCYARAEHVGIDNYAAKIAHEVKKYKAVNSRLLRSMRKVTRFTGFFIVPLGILLFLDAFFLRGDALSPSVVSTSAGLLGMLPKGLVLLISVTLASGVIKLSKKKILVQELFALESLAYVDVLCLDKTGTLTEGKMSVRDVYQAEETPLPVPFEELIGSFLQNSDDNNATFLALKNHFILNNQLSAVHKVPFSSQRKWSSMTFDGVGSLVLGAPDRLADRPLPANITKEERAGVRVLMAGFTKEAITDEKLPTLAPVAFIAITDPVRKNAVETLAFFEREGVDIKIISGDNPLTVAAIAKTARSCHRHVRLPD
ncbi:HAD-IC family P-type ATPase [Faecalispora jeddahensis]|uniref:HAD-IC family P-type ATPase n=1 Tax=Faecalispora jeddahensis TaxID=1414721 RepID=UPI0028AFEFAE|nr:HAD-IC family P-type ATPase [Faecalispora jeddahensis]